MTNRVTLAKIFKLLKDNHIRFQYVGVAEEDVEPKKYLATFEIIIDKEFVMNLDESLQLMGMQDESLTKRRSNNG